MSFKAGTRVVKVAEIPRAKVTVAGRRVKVPVGTTATVVNVLVHEALREYRDAVVILDLAGDDGTPCAIHTGYWKPLSDNDTNGKTFAELKRDLLGLVTA